MSLPCNIMDILLSPIFQNRSRQGCTDFTIDADRFQNIIHARRSNKPSLKNALQHNECANESPASSLTMSDDSQINNLTI